MEIFLWVLVPLLLVGLGWWWLSRWRRRASEQMQAAVSAETAREAAAVLDEQSHRMVYRQLGMGNVMGAVQAYRAATGAGVRQCIVAVRSLERYPQEFRDGPDPRLADGSAPHVEPDEPRDGAPGRPAGDGAPGRGRAPDAGAPRPTHGRDAADADAGRNADGGPSGGGRNGDGGTGDGGPDAAGLDAADLGAAAAGPDDLVVPDSWTERFGSDSGRTTSTFKISAEKDGRMREYSSDDLPPAERDQFQSLIRDHEFAGAADLLARYSGLDPEPIRQLLESAPVEGPTSAQTSRVSDFRFEGEGPDGRISFSAADLPEPDRQRFLDDVSAGRLHEAAGIVHRHTGLPEDTIVQLLEAFGEGP